MHGETEAAEITHSQIRLLGRLRAPDATDTAEQAWRSLFKRLVEGRIIRTGRHKAAQTGGTPWDRVVGVIGGRCRAVPWCSVATRL